MNEEGKQKSAPNLVFTANHKVFNSPNLCDPEVDLLVWWVLEDGVQIDLVQFLLITQHPVYQIVCRNTRPGSLINKSFNLKGFLVSYLIYNNQHSASSISVLLSINMQQQG